MKTILHDLLRSIKFMSWLTNVSKLGGPGVSRSSHKTNNSCGATLKEIGLFCLFLFVITQVFNIPLSCPLLFSLTKKHNQKLLQSCYLSQHTCSKLFNRPNKPD